MARGDRFRYFMILQAPPPYPTLTYLGNDFFSVNTGIGYYTTTITEAEPLDIGTGIIIPHIEYSPPPYIEYRPHITEEISTTITVHDDVPIIEEKKPRKKRPFIRSRKHIETKHAFFEAFLFSKKPQKLFAQKKKTKWQRH